MQGEPFVALTLGHQRLADEAIDRIVDEMQVMLDVLKERLSD